MFTFEISRLPRIIFGSGKLATLPGLIEGYGKNCLLIRGAASLTTTPQWQDFSDGCKQKDILLEEFIIDGEPSPQIIDTAVQQFHRSNIDVVVAIGGGSVLDAGKAIAGLLPHGNSVMDHLEGVGRGIPYHGPAKPFIAAPTTAGTGSEATKNAVLSVQGHDGFKKSFRHECLVPEYAVVDPDLMANCPAQLIANQGMDALTQLLESIVSTKANAMTHALASHALAGVNDAIIPAWQGGSNEQARQAREKMAYGALISGITLAQVGLGSVHGLASPLGAFFPIPHGAVCGTLVAVATEVNLKALKARDTNNPALQRYAEAGRLCANAPQLNDNDAHDALLSRLYDLSETLNMPRLSEYGISPEDIPKIVENSRGSSMKTNPIVLTDEEIAAIVKARI